MSDATKQPAPNQAVAELRRINIGVKALVGTGNIIIGSIIVWSADATEYGPDPSKILAGCFILCGIVQKIASLSECVDLLRNRR